MFRLVSFFFSVIALNFFTSCSSTDVETFVEDCSGVDISFSAEVNPIIQNKCATNSGCHGSGSNHGPGPLLTYTQIYTNRNAIKSVVASGSMPKNSTLTTDQKNTIICWINNGALNN